MTSPGKLSSAIVEFVAPLRLWHSLRPPSDGWFRGERPADRRALEGVAAKTGSVASTSSTVQESQERRGRARRSRVVLNSPFFGHPQRRLVQSERRYGAEPRLHGFFMEKRITFDFCLKTLTRFTHL